MCLYSLINLMAKRKKRYGKQRGKKRPKSRAKRGTKANAKKIRSNRKAIRSLQKDSRASFTRQFNAKFNLVNHGPMSQVAGTTVIERPLRVACFPIMPLCQYDQDTFGVDKDPQSWGITPPDLGLQCIQQDPNPSAPAVGGDTGGWINGQIGTGQVNTWPISKALYQFSHRPDVSTGDQFSKLRHAGGTLRWSITAKQPIISGESMPGQILAHNTSRPFSRLRPRPVRVVMVVVSAKKQFADSLLRDRKMRATDWNTTMTTPPQGSLPGGLAQGNLAFALHEGEDYIYGSGLYNKVEMNRKLWNVHSTRTMDFGYRSASPALPVAHNPQGPGAGAAQPGIPVWPTVGPQSNMDAQDDGLSTKSNWYQQGSIKVPSYGKMYDLHNAQEAPGVLVTDPHAMSRNDVANEKLRFILIFCDGHGSGSVADANSYLRAAGSSLQLQMQVSWRTKYSASQGAMI